MKKIIAIGGGEIGRPGYPMDTIAIDKESIRLTGKKHPKLLFVPTASSDAERYCEIVKKYFGKKLGCMVDVLYLINGRPARKTIEDMIMGSDIVYVGGGNTLKMMKIWRKTGVDKMLIGAWENGVVMSGLSAGSVCWFKYGNSDSRKFADPKAGLIKVRGLGLIGALHCPHYDTEPERKPDLKRMMRKTAGVAIAIDNCCAMEIVGDDYRIISSKASAQAYRTYWWDNKYHKEILRKEKKFKPLSELLTTR